MNKKRLIWMMAMCLALGVGTPATALAEESDAKVAEAADTEKETTETSKKSKKKKETAEAAEAEIEKAAESVETKAKKSKKKTEETTEETEPETEASKESEEETAKAETQESEETKVEESEEETKTEKKKKKKKKEETEAEESEVPETQPETQPEGEEIGDSEVDVVIETVEESTEDDQDDEKEEETEKAEKTEKKQKKSKKSSGTSDYSVSLDFYDNIDYTAPSLPREFRFVWDEDAPRALILGGTKIYESQSEEARVVGRSEKGSLVYILADADSDWVYVESGEVRGFVQQDDLDTGELLELALSLDDETVYPDAQCIISPMYNAALEYTMTTGTNPVVEAAVVVAAEEMGIYDRKNVDNKNAVAVGSLEAGDVAYVLAEVSENLVFVESGDVRGFVDTSTLIQGEEAESMVEEAGDDIELAEELVDPEDNPVVHYTVTSTQEADAENALRSALIDFAKQFLGGRYVWGGTTLGVGVDCSGYVQQLYKNFGYSLPRTSREQSKIGTRIAISEAKPGDLIFYTTGGEVHHVSMYIGDGKVIHARSRKAGICITGISKNACWAVRVIE